MSGRAVHAIRVHLGGLADQSIIIWLNKATEMPCARLLDSRKSWMTATRGDVVMLTADQQTWQKKYIAPIELYRVFQAEHNSEIVESAQAWIDAGVSLDKL
jgi:hypothetical protein